MAKRMITLLIILTIMSFFHKNRADDSHDGPVTFLEYKKSGMCYCNKFSYEQLEDGTCTFSKEVNWKEETKRTVQVPASVGEELWQMVVAYNMLQYKSLYTPRDDVRDGVMWELEVRFAKGQKLYTEGENEWPDGGGIKRLEEYLNELWKKYSEAAASE